jgi:hypothetical protein
MKIPLVHVYVEVEIDFKIELQFGNFINSMIKSKRGVCYVDLWTWTKT